MGFSTGCYASVEDGLGEASGDLTPGSPFLRRLNARPRNPRARYSVILGNKGFLTEAELAALREALRQAGEKNRIVRFLGNDTLRVLADLDEVIVGKGDGAVSLARGRLEGVKDTVVLPFDHLDITTEKPTPGAAIIEKAVLERLRAR